MFGPPLPGELGWGVHSQCRVRPVGVVLVSPVGDKHLGFEQGAGLPGREQLIADLAAVGFCPGVLPWRAGLDVAGAGEAASVSQRVRGELGPVAAADELRNPAGRCDLAENGDGGVGVDAVGGQVR